MKKFSFFFLFAALLMLIVLGCTKAGDTTAASSGSPTLIWWLFGTQPTELSETVRTMSDYTMEKLGVRFEIRMAGWADMYQRFTTVINSGEYFDLMFTDYSNYNPNTTLGAFAEIEDLVKTEAPGLMELIPPLVWDGVRIKGKIYAVPTYKDSSRTVYQIWDETYVKKYNIDITKTGYADLDRAFRTMKQGEGRRFYPFPQAKGSNNSLFINYDSLSVGLEPLGVRLDDTSRRVVNTLEQPDVIDAHRYMYQWYQAGIINADANLAEDAPRQKPFMLAQGWPSAAILWAALEGVDTYLVQRWKGPVYTTDSIQGSMNAVSANSRHKAESLKFLELANTDRKFRDMLAYGLEGKHFEYVSPVTIQKLNNDWTLSAYQQATFFNMSTEANQAAAWDEVRELNEHAEASALLGFSLDITNIRNEVAACKTVWEKNRFDLKSGAVDPDTALPACTAELKLNGFDRIITEAQRQIDEYFASANQQ
jgi:putative aldouronate transport system substrate-binding protein